jgi:hypothetical protein
VLLLQKIQIFRVHFQNSSTGDLFQLLHPVHLFQHLLDFLHEFLHFFSAHFQIVLQLLYGSLLAFCFFLFFRHHISPADTAAPPYILLFQQMFHSLFGNPLHPLCVDDSMAQFFLIVHAGPLVSPQPCGNSLCSYHHRSGAQRSLCTQNLFGNTFKIIP